MMELDTTAKSVKIYFFKSLGLTNTSNQFMKESLSDITVKSVIEHFLKSLAFLTILHQFMKELDTAVKSVTKHLSVLVTWQVI